MVATAFQSILLLNLLVSTLSSLSQQPLAQGKSQQNSSLSLDHTSWSLGLRLYSALRSNSSNINILISPVLLASSLRALSYTAKDTTAGQLHDLLKMRKEEKKAEEALLSTLNSMSKANGTSYTLHASSALFSKQVPTLEKTFLKKLKAQFGLDHVDLIAGNERVDMETLHSWAKEKMGGVETVMLTEKPATTEEAIILASAFHFKGFWDHGFDKDNEDLRNFLGTKYTKVEMMHQAGVYRHYEDIENMVQVLELELWGGNASMVLLLPFHVENLTRLERLLTLERLEKWLGKLSHNNISLSLPRVNISSALSLQKELVALGMVDAWDQKVADFSGLGKRNLHMGDILHWAALELASESNSKDSTDEKEHVKNPKLFYADHSFIILVKDNNTGALLLLGALDLAEGKAIHDEL